MEINYVGLMSFACDNVMLEDEEVKGLLACCCQQPTLMIITLDAETPL